MLGESIFNHISCIPEGASFHIYEEIKKIAAETVYFESSIRSAWSVACPILEKAKIIECIGWPRFIKCTPPENKPAMKKDAGLPPYEQETLIWVKAENLKFTAWNPKERVDLSRPHMKKLRNAIKTLGGIYQSVCIDKEGSIIEGNRRTKIALDISQNDDPTLLVPCFVANTDYYTAEQIYHILNSTQRKILGKELLEIYFNNPNALPEKKLQQLRIIENRMGGPQNLLDLQKRGFSMDTYVELNSFMKILGQAADILNPFGVANWVINHRLTHRLRSIKKSDIPKREIAMAILFDKTISQEEINKGKIN